MAPAAGSKDRRICRRRGIAPRPAGRPPAKLGGCACRPRRRPSAPAAPPALRRAGRLAGPSGGAPSCLPRLARQRALRPRRPILGARQGRAKCFKVAPLGRGARLRRALARPLAGRRSRLGGRRRWGLGPACPPPGWPLRVRPAPPPFGRLRPAAALRSSAVLRWRGKAGITLPKACRGLFIVGPACPGDKGRAGLRPRLRRPCALRARGRSRQPSALLRSLLWRVPCLSLFGLRSASRASPRCVSPARPLPVASASPSLPGLCSARPARCSSARRRAARGAGASRWPARCAAPAGCGSGGAVPVASRRGRGLRLRSPAALAAGCWREAPAPPPLRAVRPPVRAVARAAPVAGAAALRPVLVAVPARARRRPVLRPSARRCGRCVGRPLEIKRAAKLPPPPDHLLTSAVPAGAPWLAHHG